MCLSSRSWTLERTLQQCVSCQDTVSLYRLGLKVVLDSLSTDQEKHVLREVTSLLPTLMQNVYTKIIHKFISHNFTFFVCVQLLCLLCASHNGMSESEALELFTDLCFPALISMLHSLQSLLIITYACGLIRFQHPQVCVRVCVCVLWSCVKQSINIPQQS